MLQDKYQDRYYVISSAIHTFLQNVGTLYILGETRCAHTSPLILKYNITSKHNGVKTHTSYYIND